MEDIILWFMRLVWAVGLLVLGVLMFENYFSEQLGKPEQSDSRDYLYDRNGNLVGCGKGADRDTKMIMFSLFLILLVFPFIFHVAFSEKRVDRVEYINLTERVWFGVGDTSSSLIDTYIISFSQTENLISCFSINSNVSFAEEKIDGEYMRFRNDYDAVRLHDPLPESRYLQYSFQPVDIIWAGVDRISFENRKRMSNNSVWICKREFNYTVGLQDIYKTKTANLTKVTEHRVIREDTITKSLISDVLFGFGSSNKSRFSERLVEILEDEGINISEFSRFYEYPVSFKKEFRVEVYGDSVETNINYMQ